VTLDLERRMFCVMDCFKFEAAAGVVELLRLRDVDECVEPSFWSAWEKKLPMMTQCETGDKGRGRGRNGGCRCWGSRK
jgi:hypothetical protein